MGKEGARKVLPNYGQDKHIQEGAQAKRQRSLELPEPSGKRSKIQLSVSFAKNTKGRVLIGLIDIRRAGFPGTRGRQWSPTFP